MKRETRHGRSIRIYLEDGTPDGIRLISKDNWSGIGFAFSRPLVGQVIEHPEFGRAGIYILVGEAEAGDLDIIYVGKGDPLKRRLGEQNAEKDFWTKAVAFTSSSDGEINTAHAQYLEARLIRLAKEAKRCQLDNKATPELPTLSSPDRALAETFLAEMLPVLPLLAVDAFEKPKTPPSAATALHLRSKGIEAKGYDAPQGFVVLKGSQAVTETTRSFAAFPNLLALRQQLLNGGVLQAEGAHLTLVADHVFSSPSAAAGILLGNSTNGREAWKDANGVTLKQIQAAAAGDFEDEEAE